MKIFHLSIGAILLLSACQNKAIDETQIGADKPQNTATIIDESPIGVQTPPPLKVPRDGRITLSPETLVSEDAACILPLRVSNGTDASVSVSMFGFTVTGPGEDDTGNNMFAQLTPPGEARTARVILIGQACSAFDTVTINEVLCVSNDTSCPVAVSFEDSDELKLIGPN